MCDPGGSSKIWLQDHNLPADPVGLTESQDTKKPVPLDSLGPKGKHA